MMTLNEIKKAVDHLSPEDRRRLRDYLEEHAQEIPRPTGINLPLLEAALADLRAGLSDEDLAAITWAMNVEYIEPVDGNEWKDDPTS